MYLGLDLGTSGLKALVIDDAQRVVAQASAGLEVTRPQSGWSEQDPLSWIAACESVLRDLPSDVKAQVQAIGLSGQMHGAVMLDASDAPLAPCILWNDTRSAGEADAMDADPKWRNVTGNIVFPGFTAPKLAWMRTHRAEIFERIDKVLLPKDFLRLWLTGEHVSEMSDAAGTSWLNTAKRDWSDELLAASGLSRAHMPRLVEGSDISGVLRAEVASEFGLGPIPVAGGGGDNAASAIGMGVVKAGQAFVSLGTSGVLFAANAGYQPDPESAVHTFCHAVPETWHQMGVILACTDALNWAAGLFETTAAEMTAGLEALQAPGRARFLPYLGGERTPLASASVRAGLLGLEHATDKAAVTRAVLEGTCFAFADCRDALEATGTRIERVLAVGGGTHSEYWLRALATTLEVPLMLPDAAELGGAFGAARLGMMAATGDLSIANEPPVARVVEPDFALTEAFREAHESHRKAAAFLKDYS
ncbi:MAG: xylulokinase [Boseongicola sp.]|nr:xylulokinase [Boseongicola sp.]